MPRFTYFMMMMARRMIMRTILRRQIAICIMSGYLFCCYSPDSCTSCLECQRIISCWLANFFLLLWHRGLASWQIIKLFASKVAYWRDGWALHRLPNKIKRLLLLRQFCVLRASISSAYPAIAGAFPSGSCSRLTIDKNQLHSAMLWHISLSKSSFCRHYNHHHGPRSYFYHQRARCHRNNGPK